MAACSGDNLLMNQARYIPAYAPLEHLRVAKPVDRIGYIRSQCQGQRVLDLGAMDETAYQAKQGNGTWLHEEIAAVAARVVGIDSSSLVPDGGLRTAGNAVIFRADIAQLDAWLRLNDFQPDIVVAGELIEHLENPLAFLRQINSIDALRGRTMILTTPNASAAHNGLISLLSRESTHHDHLAIFSFKTLSTLCVRAGFQDWSIRPYFSRFTEMKLRNRGIRRAIVAGGERAINVLEWLFPLTGFGFVVRVTI